MRKLRRRPQQLAAMSTGPKPSVVLASTTPNLKPERRREQLTLSKKDSPRWLAIRDKAGCKTNMELLRWLLTLAEKQLGITARCALQLPEKGKKSGRDKCLRDFETEKEKAELEEKKSVRPEDDEEVKKKKKKDISEQTLMPPSSNLSHTTKDCNKKRSSPRTKKSKLPVQNDKRTTLRSAVACKNSASKKSSNGVLCKDDENSLPPAVTDLDSGINDADGSKTKQISKKEVTPHNNEKKMKMKSISGSREDKTLLTRKQVTRRRCSVRLLTKKVKKPEELRRQRYARRGRVLVPPLEEPAKKNDRSLRARDKHDGKLQKESSNTARKESAESFQCSKCPKTYTRESSVKRHEKTHTRDSFVCQDCGKSCKSSSHLWAHKQRTHIRKFKCAHCYRKFGLADQLAKHERTHTGEKPFACQNCNKSFASSQMLNDHKECHSEGRPYLCHECGVSFKRRDAMLHHVRRNHKPRKSFDCNLCEKTFKNRTSLTNHLEFHQNVTEGKKPYKCDICGNVYTTPKTLQGHLNRHMRTETFQCKVCQKIFRCRHHLIRHELVHRNTKPFTCPECNRGFTQHSNMMVHRRMHTGEKPYQCDICGEKFRQNVSLKTHKHKVHDINMWKDNPPAPNVGRPVGTGTGAKPKKERKSEKKKAESEKPLSSNTNEMCGANQGQEDESNQKAQPLVAISPLCQPVSLQQIAIQQPLEEAVKLSSQHHPQVESDQQQQGHKPSQPKQSQPQLPLQQQLVTQPQNPQESLKQQQQTELQYHNQIEDAPSHPSQVQQSEQQKQHHQEQSHQEQNHHKDQEQGSQKQYYQEQHDQEQPHSKQSQTQHHEEQHIQDQYQQKQTHQEHHHRDQQHHRLYDQGQHRQDQPQLYQQKNGVQRVVEALGKPEEHITTSNFNSHYRMSSKLSTTWSVPLSSASSHPNPVVPPVASNNLTNLTQYLPPPSPHHHPDNSMPLRQSQFSSNTHQHLQALLEYNPPVTNSPTILHPSPSMPHSSLLNSSLSQTSHVHPHSAPKSHLQGLHRFPKPPFVNFHPHPHQTLLSSPQPSPNSFNLCHTPDLTPPTDGSISCPSPSPLTPLLSSPLTAPPQDHPNSHSSLPSRPWSMSQHESSNQQAAMALASMHYPPQVGAQSQPRLPYMGYVNPSMQFSLPTHPGSSSEQRWNN